MSINRHERPKDRHNVLQLQCAPLACVRIGFVGLGVRAKRAVERMMHIDGVEITAICDLVQDNIEDTKHILKKYSRNTPDTYSQADGWMQICTHSNVDLVYICTDWLSHAQIALQAMENGKHAAIEVPAATTIDDCWRLVDTAERTQRHCIMLENCCYDEFELAAMHMAQKGMLGEIIHAEGSYLHDLRERISSNDSGGRKWSNWQVDFMKKHNGNPYPTHGLGPIALAMNIHRGDRMKSIVSVSSKNISYKDNATSLVGNMNSSIIRTEKGHTILVQHCISLPRPYSRSFVLSGTRGFAQKYPMPHIATDPNSNDAIMGEQLQAMLEEYKHPFVKAYKNKGEEICGRRWIDYAMDCRLIYCLQKGLPTDMDVYDAAEWSALVELTNLSAANNGMPIEIPDFTRGDWDKLHKTNFTV